MSTSGTITSTMTARQIGRRALQKIGVLSSGETFTADEGEDIVSELNVMLKSWQTDCNLWRELEDSVSVTAAEVTLDPRVIDVIEARVDTGYDRPLARWEWGEFVSIPNKDQTGTPSCFTLRKERDAIKLRLWPVPSEEFTIRYTAARVIEDVTDLDQELDVPQAWLETVILNLAVRLAPEFGGDANRIEGRAAELLAQMRDMDRPASVFFQPG